jgi:hemerythrin
VFHGSTQQPQQTVFCEYQKHFDIGALVMETTKWTAALCMGDIDLDTRRKRLFRLGQVAVDFLDDEAISRASAHQMASDVVMMLNLCFEAEEELMSRKGCPCLKRHAFEHADISSQLTSLINRSVCSADEWYRVWQAWTMHVLEHDLQCSGCCQEIPNNRLCERRELDSDLLLSGSRQSQRCMK